MPIKRAIVRAMGLIICVAMVLLTFGGWGQLWLTSAYATYRAGEPTGFEWLFDHIGTNKYDRSFKLNERSNIKAPIFTADCDRAKLAGNAPYVCISRLASYSLSGGNPVIADVRWVNLPPETILKFSVARDGPRPNLGYLGPEGAVSRQSPVVGGTGKGRFEWHGRGFVTAPGEFLVMSNDVLEPGRYRVVVSTYREKWIDDFIGMYSPPPRPSLQASSRSFVITGEPTLGPIAEALRAGASKALYEFSLRSHASTMAPSNALLPYSSGKNWQVIHRWGRYCAAIPTNPPYRSSISACVLDDDVRDAVGVRYIEPERVAVYGSVTVLSGLMSQEQAFALARQFITARFHAISPGDIVDSMQSCLWPASGPEVEACRAAHPYLLIDADEARFHPEFGNAWVFKMRYRLEGGTEAQRRLVQPQGQAFVRIEADRSLCILALRPGDPNQYTTGWPPPNAACLRKL